MRKWRLHRRRLICVGKLALFNESSILFWVGHGFRRIVRYLHKLLTLVPLVSLHKRIAKCVCLLITRERKHHLCCGHSPVTPFVSRLVASLQRSCYTSLKFLLQGWVGFVPSYTKTMD